MVCALVLTPLAWPGYVLSYDMNFTPRQPLRWDLLAPADSAPRAVPLDAFVSLSNVVVPGWLLQRVVLVGLVWAAVVGAYRLVPTESRLVRLVAGVGYAWTPFLAERLLLGQWGLLLAYAAFPWLVKHCLALRASPGSARPLAGVLLAAGVSALTPSGGLIAALSALVLLAGVPWRRYATVAAGLAVLNAPWVLASLSSTAATRSDPAGVSAFAARAENWSGSVGALLGTGGIWNAATTPATRASAVTPLVTLLLLALAGCGVAVLLRRMPHASRLLALGLAGLALAALGTLSLGRSLLGWLVAEVPGAGLLRDGQKFLLPYALALVVCVALGAERLSRRASPVVLIGALLLPPLALPDLVFGGLGALRPVHYPSDWEAVSRLVAEQPGEVLSLPLAEYRRYSWNRDRVVLDPAPRYLPVPVLTDDTLVVGGKAISGENPRVADLRARLADGRPVDVPWALVQHRGPAREPVPASWQPVFDGPALTLYRTGAMSEVEQKPAWPVIAAEVAMFALMTWAGWLTGSTFARHGHSRGAIRGDSVPGIPPSVERRTGV